MKIENEDIRVLADYDDGITAIESKQYGSCRIDHPRMFLSFECAGKKMELSPKRPDALSEDGASITLTYFYKFGGLAGNRVQVDLRVSIANDGTGVVLFAHIKNRAKDSVRLDHIRLLDVDAKKNGGLSLGHGITDWSFFKQGFQSFSATGPIRVDEKAGRPRFKFLRVMEENPTNPQTKTRGDFISEWVTQISNRSTGHGLLVGFVEGARALSDVRLKVLPKKGKFLRLTARSHFDGITLSPGQSIQTEPLLVAFAGKSQNLLEHWASFVGRRMDARIPVKAPVGWCSWYYYYSKVDENDILINLNHLSGLKESMTLDYVQVDDGYEREIGDWLETSPRFPSGMEEVAKRILDAGLAPGIWTAPFYARPKSNLFQHHRDWFLRDAKGGLVNGGWNPLWGGKLYCLDPTHPGAQDYLRKVFSTFRQMGYRVFKCDFLYAAALPAVRHDPNTTRAQALRIGLEVIRESIGDDSFLLGCGCPILPAVGVVDGMRIGMDVTPFWDNKTMRKLLGDPNALCTRSSILNTLNRAFMHNRLFANDPDCLLVRQDRNRLSLGEIETLASAVALSGGMLVMSDNMKNLSESRLEIIKTTLRNRCDQMVLLDPHKHFEPEVAVGRKGNSAIVGLFNFSNKTVSKVIDLKEMMSMDEVGRIIKIRDIWKAKDLQQLNGLIRFAAMKPRSSRLLEIRLAGKG